MLERMWNKGDLPAWLVEMWTDTATMESSMEISLKRKKKIKLPYDSAILLLGIYPEKTTILRQSYPNVHCSTIYNS